MKSKETNEEFINRLVNKSLEPYKVTFQEVKKTLYNELPWYQHFTFKTKEEYESWKDYCKKEIKKRYKINSYLVDMEFEWLNLTFGLRNEYEQNTNN